MGKKDTKQRASFMPTNETEKLVNSYSPYSNFAQSTYTPGLKEYEEKNPGTKNYLPGVPISPEQLYYNQSTSDILLKSVRGFGNQAKAGFLKALGSWDMQGLSDMATGSNKKGDYSNWANDMADEILAESAKSDNIYQNPNGSIWNGSYLGKQIQSAGLTGGIMAETVLEQIALAYMTGGTANLESLPGKANMVRSMIKQGTFGAFKGIQETQINALETMSNVQNILMTEREQRVEKKMFENNLTREQAMVGEMSDEDIHVKANEAATLNFRAEALPLMALNAFQFGVTFGAATKLGKVTRPNGTTGWSGLGELGFNKVFDKIPNPILRKGAKGLFNPVTESFEEGVQTGIQKYSVGKTLDRDVDYFDEEMRDSMIGGFIGGGMFSAMGSVYNYANKKLNTRNLDYLHNSFLNELPKRFMNSYEQKVKSEKAFDDAVQVYNSNPTQQNKVAVEKARYDYEKSQKNAQSQATLDALHIDYLTGNESAFESHVTQMEQIYEAVTSNDIAKLEKLGLMENGKEKFEGSFDLVKETFQKNISDAYKIKELLEDNLLNTTADFESAWDITKNQFTTQESINGIAQNNMQFEATLNKNPQYNLLSSEGKERFKIQKELELLNQFKGQDVLGLRNNMRLQELQERLDELAPYSSTDSSIASTINANNVLGNILGNIALNEDIDYNIEELKKLQDKKNIAENIAKRQAARNARVIKGSTKANKQKKKEELERQNQLNEATNAAIEREAIAKALKEAEEAAKAASGTTTTATPDPMLGGMLFDPNDFTIPDIESGTSAEDEAAFVMQPHVYTPGDEAHDKVVNNYADVIKAQYESLKTNANHTLTPKEMFNLFIDKLGADKAYKSFNFFKEGWKKAGLPVDDKFDNILKDIFAPLERLVDINAPLTTTEDLEAESKKTETALAGQDFTSHTTIEGTPIVYTGTKVAEPVLKIPFLGIKYVEVLDEESGQVKYVDVSEQLNFAGGANLNVLLNYHLLRPGEQFEIVVDDTWIDVGIEKGSQEWIDKVPMKLIYKGVEVAYAVHEVAWWNTKNTADFSHIPDLTVEARRIMQQELITQGQNLTRQLRNYIVSNGGKATMEVTNKSNGVSYTNKDGVLKSVAEVSPKATMAFAMNGQLHTGVGQVFAGKILNIKDLQFKGIATYMINQVGYENVEGELVPVYVANQVISNHDQASLKEYSNSLSRIYRAIDVVNNNAATNEYTVEMANKILDEVSKISGISKKEILFKTGNIYKGMEKIKLRFPEKNNQGQYFVMFNKQAVGKNLPIVKADNTVEAKPYDEYVKENVHTNKKFWNIQDANGETMAIMFPQPRLEFKPVDVNSGINTHTPGTQQLASTLPEQNFDDVSDIEYQNFKNVGLTTTQRLQAIATKLANNQELSEREKEIYAAQKTLVDNFNTPQEITEITSLQRRRIIQFLFNKILRELSTVETLNKTTIKEAIENAMENHLNFLGDTPEYKYLLENKDEILGLGVYSKQHNTVKDNILSFLSVELEEVEDDVTLDEDGVLVKGGDKASYEVSVRTALSTRTKMYFAGIAEKPSDRVVSEEFAGLPEYYSVDDIFDGLQQALVNVPNDMKSFTNRVEAMVKINPKEFGFLTSVLTIFNDAPTQVKKELLYRLNQSKVEMFFSMYSKLKDGSYKLQSLNSNSRDPKIALAMKYKNNFNSSPLISTNKTGYTINTNVAESLLNIFAEWEKLGDISLVSDLEYMNWLSNFGIDINDVTAKEYKTLTSKKGFGSNSSLHGKLAFNLKAYLKHQKESQVINPAYIFLHDYVKTEKYSGTNIANYDNAGFIKDIIAMEVKNTFNPMRSMYIAGKTINSFAQPNFVTEQLNELKNPNGKMFANLLDSPFSKHSYLLDILGSNNRALGTLGLSYVSLEALKQRGQKPYQKTGITDLSSQDLELALLAQFMHDGVRLGEYNGFDIREAKMVSPALSDSSQAFLLNAPAFVINKLKLDFDSEGNITLPEEILNLLYSQIVSPELDRIIGFIKANVSTNIVGQDIGSQMFTVLPQLNALRNGENFLLEDLHLAIKQGTSIEDVMNNYMGEIHKLLSNTIKDSVESKIKLENGTLTGDWVKDGYVDEAGKVNFLDAKYLESTGGTSGIEKVRIAAYDYVINYILSQSQWQMLFAGDFSNYFSDSKHNFSSIDGKTNVLTLKGIAPEVDRVEALSKEYERVTEIAKINLSKRLKALLSPGNRIANSFDQETEYLQVMINDVEGPSTTIKQIVKLWYPSLYAEHEYKMTELEDVSKQLVEVESKNPLDDTVKTLKARRAELIKSLQQTFPDVSAYFKITGTDAQEYTTWQEHLHILYNQGMISESMHASVKAKLKSQSKNGVNESNKLTYEEKKTIFQPIKPLHAGLYFDDIYDKNDNLVYKTQRFVYVKTSSFPLLPEMVQNSDLDKVRINLEKLGKGANMKVRASYQSGNKVGAVKNAISFNRLLNTEDESVVQELAASAYRLKRGNFSIQQDKPFKTDKNIKANKRDEISRGTQFEDILLGNDINKISEKIFPNFFDARILTELGIEVVDGKVNGKDLYAIYNHVYAKEQELLKKELYNKLGLNEVGEWEDNIQSLEKIRDLLQSQLTQQQDKDVLEIIYIVETKDATGTKKIDYFNKAELAELNKTRLESNLPIITPTKGQFNLPLWITPNSRKFESVLNATVGNKLIRLKLPGFSSPVASQEGFKYQELDNYTGGGITFTSAYNPELGLQATHFEDGSLKYAQVLVANKFRGEDGQIMKLPTIEVDGKMLLDTSKVDPSLLSMFSFRIPTSAHQSGAIIEIVGFLPHEQGDLMIVPKDHTTQLGEDYDIDTRYMYFFNTTVVDGVIRPLKYSDIPITTKEQVEQIYRDYKEYKQQLLDEYFSNKHSVWYNNRERIIQLAFVMNDIKVMQNSNKINREEVEALRAEMEYLHSELITPTAIKQEQQKLQAELDFYLNLLTEAFNNEKNEAYRNYVDQKKIEKIEKAILENELINLYKSIYSTTDEKIQKTISATLSTDFAEDTADLIDEKLSEGSNYFLYDDRHQKKVLRFGASGKLGIGVHSNWVVLNSLFQQMSQKPQLINGYTEEGEEIPFYMVFGNLATDGTLGLITPDANGFTTTKVNMINQNCSTDNQKLQVMGRRNENKHTINVFALLNNLGIISDKLSNGQVVGYSDLFISQPIIRRYVELKESYDSISSEYSSSVDKEIKEKLIEEFGEGVEWASFQEDGETITVVGTMSNDSYNKVSSELTAQTLYDNLVVNEGSYTNENQWAVLQKFLTLQSKSIELNEVQQLINIEGKGLGVSYFDVIAKKNALRAFLNSSGNIKNINTMFGEIENVAPDDTERRMELEKEGYVMLETKPYNITMVKPTTAQNHKLINSTALAYNLWGNVFPFEGTPIETQINEILVISGKKLGSQKAMDMSYKALAAMQDFIYSWSGLGQLFDKDIQAEREALFIRSTTNEPLAMYLDRLKRDGHPIFKEAFFRDLEFEIGFETEESLIKYSLNDKSNFNKNEIYKIFLDLMDSNKEVITGQPYTYAELAKDLLKYSMLSNQENGAIGFRNYIPISLFEKYGVAESLRLHASVTNSMSQSLLLNGDFKTLLSMVNGMVENGQVNFSRDFKTLQEKIQFEGRIKGLINRINDKHNTNIHVNFTNNTGLSTSGVLMVGDVNMDNMNSIFVRQYFQHNPGDAARLNWKNKKDWMDKEYLGVDFSILDTFTSSVLEGDYYTIKNPLNQKFTLYVQVEPGIYRRLETLGAFGVNEYQPFQYNAKSMFEANRTYTKTTPGVPVAKLPTKTSMDKTLVELIKEIADSNLHHSDVAKMLLEFVQNVPINYIDMNSINTSTGIVDANGAYTTNDMSINVKGNIVELRGGEIYLNINKFKELLTSDKSHQYVLLEEMLHSITTNYIREYINESATHFNDKGDLVVSYKVKPEEVPIAVTRLLEVYRQAGKQFVESIADRNKQSMGTLLKQLNNNVIFDGVENRFINLTEFMAGIMFDERFRTQMSKLEYKGESILSRFAKAISKILAKVLPNSVKNNITENGYNAIMDLLDAKHAAPVDFNEASATQDFPSFLDEAENLVSGLPEFDDTQFPTVLPDPDFDAGTTGFDALLQPVNTYQVINGFPFSDELMGQVLNGSKTITIRQPQMNNPSGIYNLKGKSFMVQKVNNKAVTLQELNNMGITTQEVMKAFGITDVSEVRLSHIQEWFAGKNEMNVYVFKEVPENNFTLQPSVEDLGLNLQITKNDLKCK